MKRRVLTGSIAAMLFAERALVIQVYGWDVCHGQLGTERERMVLS